MYFKFTTPLKLADIPQIPFEPAQYRDHFRLAVIDNEPFIFGNELRKHHYNLTELGDISDVSAVAEYPIVACDIRDIGKHFGTEYEGAHVIAEMRKLYPDKFLIAFSGGSFGPSYKKYWDSCDVFLRRDGGFDQWIATLDDGIRKMGDPVVRWKRVRQALLEAGISTFEVFLLEEAYIKSVIKGDTYHLAHAIKRVKRLTSAGEALNKVAEGLIASVKLFIQLKA